MEVSVFPKLAHQLKRFVEVRLDTDPGPEQEKNTAYQKELTHTTARPVYAVVEPREPKEALDVFVGADLLSSPQGKNFSRFLERNIE